MQNRLADMYLSISEQVGEEVRTFWHELEGVTNARQHQLFGVLNQKLQVRPMTCPLAPRPPITICTVDAGCLLLMARERHHTKLQ